MTPQTTDRRIRVLVVDDSAYNRRTITKILEKSPFIEVLGTAKDGEEGLRRALDLKPDLVTLDLEMPKLDGFAFLRILMARQPVPILVVSSRNEGANVFKALELGAVDFVSKPTQGISSELENIGDELLSKVLAIKQLRLENAQNQFNYVAHARAQVADQGIRPTRLPAEGEAISPGAIDVVAIGSSTGGPGAITSILSGLPARLPIAYLVAQHMPSGFTRPFAERLDRFTALEVKEAEDGEVVRPGRVYISPGGASLTVERYGSQVLVILTPRKESDKYVPSVDALMRSVARAYAARCLAVILTGMGDDGMEGVEEVKRCKGIIIAESEETSVIYGMPRKAISTGVVDHVLPLFKISEAIVDLFLTVR
jgi:two-component system chemotaxis response regulator CheB